MFHVDFRYRLKAIESLRDDLPDNIEALVSNLDLILKWLPLRFFDTNSSVILKSLHYLQAVLNALYRKQYCMHKNEAASFIPYLMTNVRQRTECLDLLGYLIPHFGRFVRKPGQFTLPSAALHKIAEQIADRDNSVRNAALNCIEQACYLEGEGILKLVGQISEKVLPLLEERINRASKNRPGKSASLASTSASTASVVTRPVPDNNVDYDDNDNKREEPKEPDEIPEERCIPITRTLFNVATQPTDVSPICPDELEPTSATVDNIEENAFTIDDNVKTRFYKTSDPVDPPRKTLASLTPPNLAPPRTDLRSLVTTPPTSDSALDQSIRIGIQSMIATENLIKSEHVMMIQTKEDDVIDCVNMQLQLLQTYKLESESDNVLKGFHTAFAVTSCFFDSRGLGRNVTPMHLQDLVHEMLTLLAENKLERLKQSEAYTRVINNIVVKIIDNSNHTSIICVLIELLRGCAESREQTNYEELVLEFLRKIIEMIPNWDDDLDYDTILLEVYLFYKEYPSWWGNDSRYLPNSIKPLDTIGRLLHDIIIVKGRKIPSHMTKINNTQDSELQSCSDRLNTILNRNIPIEKTVMDPIERLEILRALESQYPASVSNQANHT